METNLAVLIDFENIAAGTEKEGLGRFNVDALMQRVNDKGRILVSRSYADWGRFSRFKQSLLSANVTMMELTSHGMQDKNRADIAMVVDALELAFTKDYIDTFVIVSGDSDFTPMVLKMRELNKRVIGIGTRRSTSRLLICACDEFIFYDAIVQKRQQRKTRASSGRGGDGSMGAVYGLLEKALEGLQRENPDPPLASIVKTAMLRKTPDFSETELGYSSFAKFLEAARKAGIVSIIRDQKSGGYRVDTPDATNPVGRVEAGANVTPEGEDWEDEFLPAGSESLVEALDTAKLHPVGTPIRMAVLEALSDVVSERAKRRRKTTMQYVTDDLRKKLRRTHPDIPGVRLRGVMEGLMRGGELIHRDGTAIRSPTASFSLRKDAEALNKVLVNVYLAALKEAGCDLSDSGLLAALLLGDSERKRDIEEALAWLGTGDMGQGDEPDLNEMDLDDLLSVGDDESEPKKEAKKEPKAEAKAADIDDVDALLVEEKPAPKKAAPKKRTRKAPAKKAAAKTEEAKVEEEVVAEKPAPKKRTTTRKRTTKTTAKAKTTKAADDAEAPEKPKRKRTRKKPEPKAEEEVSDLDALLEPVE